MNSTKIIVETTLLADITKTWNCWTAPEHIVNWNFAADDWHCPKASNDIKTGGKFSSTMASKDGKMSFDFEGIYDEVIPLKKIAYSLADGRQVEIHFESNGNQTTVIETFDPENENPIEMQKTGWQMIMNNFKKYTESK